MAEQKCEKMGGGNFAISSKEAYLLIFDRQTIKFINAAKETCAEQVIKQLSFAWDFGKFQINNKLFNR